MIVHCRLRLALHAIHYLYLMSNGGNVGNVLVPVESNRGYTCVHITMKRNAPIYHPKTLHA